MTNLSLGAVLISLLLLTACASTSKSQQEIPTQPTPSKVTIDDRRLPEISGLAASNTLNNHFWAINDSGNSASIYLIDQSLSVVKEAQLDIKNRDWEDLSAFSLRGEAWIVIAESGDNLKKYDSYNLYFYREADLINADQHQQVVAYTNLSYRYESGSINCEAVVVDSFSNSILLFGKGGQNTPVYQIDLAEMQSSTTVETKLLATIPAFVSNATDSLIGLLTGVNLNSTTGAALSADGMTLFLLTYSDVWTIKRGLSQSWQEAFQIDAEHFASHNLHQAEALSYSASTHQLLVTSEGLPAPVLRFDY